MTNEEISQIVKITLDELEARHMIKDSYQSILRVVDKRLYSFFAGAKDADVSHALRQLSDEPYLDIIYLQYRDEKTIEWIAEYFNKDTSTIKRNKKKLINNIYEQIRGK